MNSVSHMPLGEEKSFSAESYRSSLAHGSSCRLSTISGDNASIRSGSIVEVGKIMYKLCVTVYAVFML